MTSRSARSTMLYVVIPLSVAAAVLGLSIYLTHDGTSPAVKNLVITATSQAPHSGETKFACPVSLPAVALSEEEHGLDQKAQKLMGEGRFEKALASYQGLASRDPAFPGINLDLSMAFSKLNQPLPAKQAIDAQLAISMCLAQLFPNELEPYCKAEGFASTASCVKEIGSVQQSAYIQAALVQMDVDPVAKPGASQKSAAAIQVAESKMQKHTAVPGNELVKSKSKPPFRITPNSLASGEGTDAALGAYSK